MKTYTTTMELTCSMIFRSLGGGFLFFSVPKFEKKSTPPPNVLALVLGSPYSSVRLSSSTSMGRRDCEVVDEDEIGSGTEGNSIHSSRWSLVSLGRSGGKGGSVEEADA